jgi:hypothetical protein
VDLSATCHLPAVQRQQNEFTGENYHPHWWIPIQATQNIPLPAKNRCVGPDFPSFLDRDRPSPLRIFQVLKLNFNFLCFFFGFICFSQHYQSVKPLGVAIGAMVRKILTLFSKLGVRGGT